MALELRVTIEVGDSAEKPGGYVRVGRTETVHAPVTDGKASDHLALAHAVLDRLASETLAGASEQMQNIKGALERDGD